MRNDYEDGCDDGDGWGDENASCGDDCGGNGDNDDKLIFVMEVYIDDKGSDDDGQDGKDGGGDEGIYKDK